MRFHPLPDAERLQFEADGFAVWRHVLEPAQVAALAAVASRLVASDGQEMRQRDSSSDGFRNCVALDPAIAALVGAPRVVSWMMQMLSPNLQLQTSHLVVTEPAPAHADPTRYAVGWHRDIHTMPDDLGDDGNRRVEIKIAYYLTPGTAANGVTCVARGSHRWRARPCFDAAGDPPEVVVPSLAAGDALLFENRTWHAARINASSERRIVLFLGYGYRWMRPDDWVEQSPATLANLDTAGRELLTPSTRRSPDGRFSLAPSNPWLVDWAREHQVQGDAAWRAAQRRELQALPRQEVVGAGGHLR